MDVIHWDDLVRDGRRGCLFPGGTALSIGGFDGPHRGHRYLFSKVLAAAAERHIPAGLVTFTRSPRVHTQSSIYAGDVSSLRLRLEKFEQEGFAFVILIDFSEDFAKIKGTVFFDILIQTVRIKYLAVGTDFTCGYRHDTGVHELRFLAQTRGFCFDSIEQVCSPNQLRISSSRIRAAVECADFALATAFLGYPFCLDVKKIERQLQESGCIIAQSCIEQIIPKAGIYTAKAFIENDACIPVRVLIADGVLKIQPLDRKQVPAAVCTVEKLEFIGKE